ncbi:MULTISPECIES: IclR family transcriptional regulator [Paenibacillus]|uniref:IclR family transcriptional regulator n=1 Tax=Paenibacillus naphthalenovorans TaxID=162209 RepID=A0A0U2W1E5_9BACL|nr:MULTISPECIES: IclR family transcriptional regulator [Paenibacillus]ALS21197.1 IclR family transcriptional regulator [Paenibacillus naphthalenovorans]NTZ18632.1 IclR family transcriptional regulator [Paenibacillus sp. JMULE4]GCL72456.1 IclR family transcriptional regulator [Paenibacillus naphthalenovorans]SDI00422.1 DNA-binding transcriptional regulator, IclR family [Paenibacillus naphthalenovorans]
MSVISKAISILNILVPQGNEKEVSVTEISRELEMPVQSVHRILGCLSQHGFVSQNSKTRKYKLGFTIMKYSFLMWDSLMLRSVARSYMEELSRQTKETVYLTMRENMEGVYIDRIDSSQILNISEPIGLRLPLYIGASNRAMLAYLSQKTRDNMLKNVDWSSVPSLRRLTQESVEYELEKIREKGFAVSVGEVTDGTTGIGAPIFSRENTVIGSLNCAGPSTRFTPQHIEKYSSYTKKYAYYISRELGFRNLYRFK